MITNETFTTHSEQHYIWPQRFRNGNSTRCDQCRYFVEDVQQKEKSPYYYQGECHSKARKADHTHIYVRKVTSNDSSCRWWFPIGCQAGEQEELI